MSVKNRKLCRDCEYANFHDGEFFCENIDSPVNDTYNNCVTGCYACGEFKQRTGPNPMDEALFDV